MPSLFPFHFATTTESETALKLSEDRRAADNVYFDLPATNNGVKA